MKKILHTLAVALLAVATAACSGDHDETPVDPVFVNRTLRLHGGNVLVNLPEEHFDVQIPAEAADWISINRDESLGSALVLAVAENRSGAERSAVVTATRHGRTDLLATVSIVQRDFEAAAGEFLIEEIYFTGTPLPETGKPDKFQGDQYIRIRNNTDETLYADGLLCILASSVGSLANYETLPGQDFRTQYCAGTAFYRIPGDGTDVPVEPGASLTIVNNAQNHTLANAASWDATKADFEWFDVSTNDNFLDTDNPAVPNLEKWYANTLTVHTLHDRGGNAIAIAMPPVGMTAERFLAEYAVPAGTKYLFHSPNGSDFEMPLRGYFVPNTWILDAVNTGCRDAFYFAPWDASLDAGHAWCGLTDMDAARYGKAVVRKSDSEGKLIDTNNSDNDFESNAAPSLLAK